MDFANDPITNAVYNGIKRGIRVALDNECWTSAVILIYSGIDVMANLGRPLGKKEVEPCDFINWARTYIQIDAQEQISPEELYSARCAMIHTYGIESTKTRLGRARAVGYMYKRGVKVLYSPMINKDFIQLDIHALADAFFAGIDRFLVDVYLSRELRPVIDERLRKLVIHIPNSKIREHIDRLNRESHVE